MSLDFLEFAMTERTIPVDAFGPIALDLTMNAGTIRVVVDPALKQAHVALKTAATSGPSADAIRDTAVSLTGQNLRVRVPDVAGGTGGSTTIRMGNSTMTFSGGSGVQIINGNVHLTGHGGGKVCVNGREVTASGPGRGRGHPGHRHDSPAHQVGGRDQHEQREHRRHRHPGATGVRRHFRHPGR
jgi:hypothetical protein